MYKINKRIWKGVKNRLLGTGSLIPGMWTSKKKMLLRGNKIL